jgi:hypothetical protein
VIVGLIMAASIVWISMQAREKNVRKWSRRVERLAPLGRYLRADLRAVVDQLKILPTVRKARKRGWDITEIL